MLCSMPTGKSGGSNWLDRLRSTKGFPTADDGLDLGRFLSRNSDPDSDSPPIPTSESTRPPEIRRREPPGWAAGVVTTALSELFFIGGSAENSELSGKKFPRKQSNPRLCVASSNNGGGGNSNNSSVRADPIKKRKSKMKMKKKKKKRSDFAAKSPATVNSDSNSLTLSNNKGIEDEDEDEDEDEEEELRGYSRTEATVIDTSFAEWKSERVVFRKRNVWRVIEKRGKPKSFGRKKKKRNYQESNSILKASSEFIGNNVDPSLKRPLLDQGQRLRNESREDKISRSVTHNLGRDSPDKLALDFKKRPRFSSSPKKMILKGISN